MIEALVLYVAALAGGVQAEPVPIINEIASPKETVSLRYAPELGFWAPAIPPCVHYRIDARTVQQKREGTHLLDIKEVIRFTNTTKHALGQLALDCSGQTYSRIEVRVGGKPLAQSLPDRRGTPRLLTLPTPAAPGQEVVLEVDCAERMTVPEQSETLVGWYPRLWWGFPTHDDYDVKIEAPAELTVGASGRYDPETGRYSIQGAKSFGVYLGRNCKLMEADAGDVRIRAVHTDAGAACARLLLETAVDVVTFYRERFGLYPYPTLTIVPGADRPMGGYPVATALVVVHGQERMSEETGLHWRWITAHEIGHQYWGERVLEKDPSAWLWIALGIYADREYVRARGLGEDEQRRIVTRYIEGVGNGLDTTLDRGEEALEAVEFDFNNVCRHGKGFSVVSALASALGKETFERAYTRCLREFAGRRLGAAEFQRVCEEESGQDLDWFFDQWVCSNRNLQYQIESQTCNPHEGKYMSLVRVKCVGALKMPVPVAAYFQDGTVQTRQTERLLDVNELTFESATPLTRACIDPLGELAMSDAPVPDDAKGLAKGIQDLPWTGAGPAAADLFRKAQEKNLGDKDVWFKLGLTLYDGKYYAEALEAFQRAEKQTTGKDLTGFVAIVWQGHLLDLLGRRDEAIACYKKALDHDSGGTMRHGQYGLAINLAWVLERLKTPFERK